MKNWIRKYYKNTQFWKSGMGSPKKSMATIGKKYIKLCIG